MRSMKMIKVFIISTAFIIPISVAPASCDFEELGTGARPIGMGNAFVALADDVRAIAYNPAGLAYLKRSEFTADYGQIFMGLKDKSNLSTGFVALAQPLSRRKSLDERVHELRRLTAIETRIETSTAATPSDKTKEGIKQKEKITFFKDLGTIGLGISNLTLSDTVSENILRISYGRTLFNKFSGGLSAKVLYETYTQDAYTQKDPVFNSGGKSSLIKFSFDASVLYNLYPRVFWGLTATDINQPNVALNPQDRETLPAGIRSGFAYREKRVSAVIDVTYRKNLYSMNAGAERWFKNKTYALRAGGGIGSNNYKNITYGMSVNWGNIQLDYAFLYPITGVREVLGNHKISFTYRFGKAPLDELEVGSIELYYSKLQAEAEMLRARLEKAEDERSRLEKVLVEEALSRIKEKVRAEKLEATVQTGTKKEGSPVSGILPALTGIRTTQSGIKTYVTSKGDSLQSIAELFYGRKERWIEIFNLNKDKVGRGGSLKSGTVLLIPGVAGAARTEEEIIAAPQGRTLSPIRIAPTGKQGELITPESSEDSAPLPTGTVLSPLKSKPAETKKTTASKPEARSKPKSYTVLPGDTLNSIAEKIYGDAKRWKDIYNANKDKVERGSVSPGQILTIPE